jgi:hypothetical protein
MTSRARAGDTDVPVEAAHGMCRAEDAIQIQTIDGGSDPDV